MPYREVKIGREVFVTRVSEEALKEWLDNRERLREIGYPDRPPDIDTPLTRQWITHPHEKNYAEILKNEIHDTFPVYSLSFSLPSETGEIEHKLLVTFDSKEDVYLMRTVGRNSVGETLVDRTYKIPSEQASEALEKLTMIASVFLMEDMTPFIVTYSDFIDMQEESELALKELDEYYGKPMVH